MERVADYIIKKVNEAGAEHIFLITGRGILYLTDAVAKNEKIKAIPTFHEQGASYAAMAYASVHEGVSACLVSTGCAATNAITACLCAYQDNLPVVFISGNNQLNENTRHTGAEIRTYGSQEADIISLVEPITKYAVMLEKVENVAYEIEKALHIAESGRKGPVWIDIPLDVQNMRLEEDLVEHFVPEKSENSNLEVEAESVAELFNQSERPILLIGGGASNAGEDILRLTRQYNIPVVCSPAASDIFGTGNELSIGTVGSLGGSRAGNMAVQNSDFVLVIGSKLCSQLTGVKDNFAREAKVVVVDIDKQEHTKAGVKIDKLVVGDASDFLKAFNSCTLKEMNNSWVRKCSHWKTIFSLKNEDFVKELIDKNELDLYSLMDEISPVLPEDATIITDAGLEELIVPSAIQYKRGQRCLFPAAQGAMGYAIPAIIGAYAAGRKSIVCVVGDGSIMMNIQELQMISSLHIPVKILVINNNMYAVIRKRQKDLFRKRTIGNDPGDGVPAPNFERIANCFGFHYRKIGNRGELLQALPSMLSGTAEIIEIVCTPEQKYFHESYTINEKRKLVHRPIEDLSPFLPRNFLKEEMIVNPLEE